MPIYTNDPYDDGFFPVDPSLRSSIGIGPKVTKAIDAATKDWLDKHPEATTTVEDDSITNAKLKDGSVNSRVVENRSITTDKLADHAVTADKITSSAADGLRIMSTTRRGVAKVGAGLAMNGELLELDGNGDIAAAVTAWLNAHPEATTTIEDGAVTNRKIADNTITDAKLVQNGGILSNLRSTQESVGYVAGSTSYNDTYAGSALSNTNRWFLNGTCPEAPIVIHIRTMNVPEGTSASFEVWGVSDDTLTRVKKIPVTDLEAASWNDIAVGELDSYDYDNYMVSIIPSPMTVSIVIDEESGFNAYRTTDLTGTTLSMSSLSTYTGLCVSGYVDYASEPIIDIVNSMSMNVEEIEQFIGMISGETDYNHALLNSAISNTNRWFLNGYSPALPTVVHIKTLPNPQGSTARIDFWGCNDDETLVRIGTLAISDLSSNEWRAIDVPDLGNVIYEKYYVSVIPSPNTISCTIQQDSGFNALRTTDLTSTTLALSSLLTFAGLCVNGYLEYENPTIISRVKYLERIVTALHDTTNPITVNPDGSGAYETIAAAVAAATDGATILVYPGTYEEPVEAWNKTVHIIGLDRDSCIIHNSTANYATPAVEISSGSLRNFTIISDASNPTIDSSTWGYMMDYCIHVDHSSAANKTLFIDNCRLLNNHRTAIGCGLYDHNTVTISNCEIWSGKPDGYHPDPNNNRRGAVYFHNRQPAAWFSNVTEQLLVFHDNIVMCDDTIAAYISDTTIDYDMEELGYVNEMSTRFFNNIFAAKDAGGNYKTTGIIGGTGFTELLVNEPISFGNNANQFNA